MIRRNLLATIQLLAVLLLFAAPAAQGAYDPVGSGAARLRFDRGFRSFLRANQLTVRAIAPARIKGGVLTLPIIGGSLDPQVGRGSFETDGGLAFLRGRQRVPLREVRLKTKPSPLIAKVGGSQLKVLSVKRFRVERGGFGMVLRAPQLRLSIKAATRLNKKLRPERPFRSGQVLGSLSAEGSPETVTILEQNRANLQLDPGFAAKLNSLFVSVQPIFPAERADPVLTFPILSGSAISPSGSLGTLKTGGSLELLQLSSNAQVFLRELWTELADASLSAETEVDPAPPFQGRMGRIGSFALEGGAVSADPRMRTITISALNLRLQPQTAEALNQAFAEGKPVFSGGETAGVLSFAAQGQ